MKLPQRFSYRRSLSPSIGVFTYADKQSVEKPLSFKSVKIVGQKEGVTEGFDNSMMPKPSATAKNSAKATYIPSSIVMFLTMQNECSADFR